MWDKLISGYKEYILLERGFSSNTREAYIRDIEAFKGYISAIFGTIEPHEIERRHIESYMASLYDHHMSRSSQSRMLSGVRSFFQYMILTDYISVSPTLLIESPKTTRPLPDTLSPDEVVSILESIDLSSKHGHRNRAILEVLYGCGLRVSELVGLQLGDLYFDDRVIRVTGKGDKQRLVPIGEMAVHHLHLYLQERRAMTPDKKSINTVFLNNRGGSLTRVMIFHIIRAAVAATGIQKIVSPHTLRHSFATHLLAGGANIRAVQEMLGHADISTTEIYTHLDLSDLRKAIANLPHPEI